MTALSCIDMLTGAGAQKPGLMTRIHLLYPPQAETCLTHLPGENTARKDLKAPEASGFLMPSFFRNQSKSADLRLLAALFANWILRNGALYRVIQQNPW
ncbi:MAG: hypothetical protein M0Q54_04835 [Pigmentiphaga sp.]|nr:hypothetical protein [Pigmentiphaga sp.]